jgi:ABC-type uncharacterized transport system fused permease/ATPase subunit
VRVDALRILSEGHIRCLGLAILLAKGQSIQSPLVVFDDAINAIDHDHRSGIRETIFESDHFAQTQLIVTCHSNEFIKDIQQHLPAQRRNDLPGLLVPPPHRQLPAACVGQRLDQELCGEGPRVKRQP